VPASPVGNSAKSPSDTASDATNAATRIERIEIVFGRPKDWRPAMARGHPRRPMPKGGLLGPCDGCNRHIPALKRNGMKLFVGMDGSLAKTAIRASGEHGEIVEEAEAASEPEVLVRWPGLCRNGCIEVCQSLDAVLVETRQVEGSL